jgi:hypothetical protein
MDTSTAESLLTTLVTQADLSGVLMFREDATIIYSTLKNVSENEMNKLIELFSNEQDAITSGLQVNGKDYDVHRFYDDYTPSLIYGRTPVESQDGLESEGCAVSRTDTKSAGRIYIVITYNLPTLSSRAVAKLVELCRSHGK